MKLEAGVRYVLNNGLETSELIERESGEVFEGVAEGEPYESYWYPDGTYCGFDKSCPMSISQPVPLRFSRRKSQL